MLLDVKLPVEAVVPQSGALGVPLQDDKLSTKRFLNRAVVAGCLDSSSPLVVDAQEPWIGSYPTDITICNVHSLQPVVNQCI